MEKDEIVKALKRIVDFPPEGYDRRTADGYPAEIDYDDFAYNRMVDSYREAIQEVIDRINN